MSDTAARSRAKLVALIVAIAFFMQNLDGAIINTSLPQMAATFGVRPLDLSLGITAYIVAVAATIPLSGWLADRFGARTVFAVAIVVFTLASLGCGSAPDLTSFIAARIVQGFGGALMTPVGRMVVLRNASKSELIEATALITWPALIAPVIGPALGGFITTYVNWRWNFLLNVPLGAIGLACVLAFIPDQQSEERRKLDWTGFFLSSIALVALLCGLEGLTRAQQAWQLPLLLSAAGLIVGAIAVRHLRRTPAPLLQLAAFKVQTFAISTTGSGLVYRIAINATPFLLPLLFQVGFGLSAAGAGMLILFYFLGNLGMKTVTTPALRRFGFRSILVWNGILGGAAIAACGLLLPSTPHAVLVAILLLAGLTRSMQFTSLNTLAFADIDARQRGSSTTLSGMAQQVSNVLGVAAGAVLLNGSRHFRHAVTVALPDFRLVFFAIGGLAVISALRFLKLPPDAGAEVSGHGIATAPIGPETSSTAIAQKATS